MGGERFPDCSTFWRTTVYCIHYLFGQFRRQPLFEADPIMAFVFFFPYLLLCYVIFSNIFFAIIDRYFVVADVPPISLKRKLKPFLGRVFRFVEWDDDHTMLPDPHKQKEELPPSRKQRAHMNAMRVERIRLTGRD